MQQRTDDVQWQWEHDRRVLAHCNDGERLEVAQLQRLRMAGQYLGRFAELVRRLQLAFGMDHLGPSLALGLGLAGDARTMVRSMSTSLISTLVTLMPQASVSSTTSGCMWQSCRGPVDPADRRVVVELLLVIIAWRPSSSLVPS